MRRIRSIVLIVTCLLLPGCTQSNDVYTDERFYTDDYLPNYDVSEQHIVSSGYLDKQDTTYYACGPLSETWIHYYDDQTGTEGILCGKPECTHDSNLCNGYIFIPMGIQVYDQHLYWLSDATQIWRMNLQGTEREFVRTVEFAKSGGIINIYFAIHRGYVYEGYVENEVEDGETYMRLHIRQYSLADPEAPGKDIINQRYEGIPNMSWCFKGNNIYFWIDCQETNGDNRQREFLAYDIVKDQMETIWSGEEDWYTKGYVIDDDEKGMVILEAEEFQENEDLYIRKSYLDFESGTKENGEKVLIGQDYVYQGGIADGYILVFHYIEQSEDGDSDFSEYKLYDYDFNLIREGKVPDNKLYCAGIDETGILLDEYYGSDTRDYYKVYRIPTTAEGEEELLINVVRDISMFNVHGE